MKRNKIYKKKEAEFPNPTAVAIKAERFTLDEEKYSVPYLILFLINYIWASSRQL